MWKQKLDLREPKETSQDPALAPVEDYDHLMQETPRSAQSLFDRGEIAFKAKEYEKALLHFKTSREQQPDFLPSWLYELRTLKVLNREGKANEAAKELLKRRPALRDLPALRNYLDQPR